MAGKKTRATARPGKRRAGRQAGSRPGDELDRIFNLTPDLLCIAGFDMRFKRLNPAWEEILGYTREELLARPYLDFVHPDDRDSTVAEARKLTTGAPTISFINRYRCKDGTYRWMLWNSAPVPEEELIYAAARDITEQRELERMKDDFITMVSDELRTPLSALRGALALVAGERLGTLDPRGRRMLEIAREETDRLVRLTSDILDIERMEAGRYTLVKQECDAAQVVERALESMRPEADKARIVLRLPPRPARLFADPDRLAQAVTNLINNAIKFSPRDAAVEVSVAARNREVLFRVRDHGPGIPSEHRGRLFDRFGGTVAGVREKRGRGLGLFIAQAIVQRHGGRIWAESAPRRGSIFSIALPAGKKSAP